MRARSLAAAPRTRVRPAQSAGHRRYEKMFEACSTGSAPAEQQVLPQSQATARALRRSAVPALLPEPETVARRSADPDSVRRSVAVREIPTACIEPSRFFVRAE